MNHFSYIIFDTPQQIFFSVGGWGYKKYFYTPQIKKKIQYNVID